MNDDLERARAAEAEQAKRDYWDRTIPMLHEPLAEVLRGRMEEIRDRVVRDLMASVEKNRTQTTWEIACDLGAWWDRKHPQFERALAGAVRACGQLGPHEGLKGPDLVASIRLTPTRDQPHQSRLEIQYGYDDWRSGHNNFDVRVFDADFVDGWNSAAGLK
jgi:hypothetical protein